MLFQLRQLNFQFIRSHRVASLAPKLNRREEVLTLRSNKFFIRHLELPTNDDGTGVWFRESFFWVVTEIRNTLDFKYNSKPLASVYTVEL